MRIEILDLAKADLLEGFQFYEEKELGLGDYFLTNLFSDIERFNPNSEVGGTAFAAIIGRTSRREIWGSIDLIQPLRSPTSCAAKPGTAYGPSNFGIWV